MLSQLLPRPFRRPAPVIVPRPRAHEGEDDAPAGCGWFDSSHDLQHGLQVREADSQALALLPLTDWLALQVMPCYEADTPLDTGAGMIADPTLH